MIINVILILCGGALAFIPLFWDVKKKDKQESFLKNITLPGFLCILIFFIGLSLGIFKEFKDQYDLKIHELKLSNPIPKRFKLTFTSVIKFKPEEIKQIKKILDLQTLKPDNLLPFDSRFTNPAFDKINWFKNLMITVFVTFKKEDRQLGITFERAPLNIIGYHTDETSNSFTLTYHTDRDSNHNDINPVIKFYANGFESTGISVKGMDPSMIDFKNGKVTINFNFAVPIIFPMGNIKSHRYLYLNRDSITLDIESLYIYSNDSLIRISDIRKINKNVFEGEWICSE